MSKINNCMYDFAGEFLELIRIKKYDGGYSDLNSGDDFKCLCKNYLYPHSGSSNCILEENYVLPGEEVELLVESSEDFKDRNGVYATKNKEGLIYIIKQGIDNGVATVRIAMSTIQEQDRVYDIRFIINNDSTLELVCGERHVMITIENGKPIIIGKSGGREQLSIDGYKDALHDLLSEINNEEIRKILLEDGFFKFLCSIPKELLKWKALELPVTKDDKIVKINSANAIVLAALKSDEYNEIRPILVESLNDAISVCNEDAHKATYINRLLTEILYPVIYDKGSQLNKQTSEV